MGGQPPAAVMLEKRSFSLAGHRTSVALEPLFWAALEQASGPSKLLATVASVDAARPPGQSLASALRLHALSHFQTNPTLR